MILQPPPPPHPDPFTVGFLSMPTVTLMIVIAFVMHASVVMVNSRMVREYKGIGFAVWAAVALAIQYAIVYMFPPGNVVGSLTNILTITGRYTCSNMVMIQ